MKEVQPTVGKEKGKRKEWRRKEGGRRDERGKREKEGVVERQAEREKECGNSIRVTQTGLRAQRKQTLLVV